MKKALIFFLSIPLILASCAKNHISPPDDENQTLLIVPMKAENTSVQQFGFYQLWKITKVEEASDTEKKRSKPEVFEKLSIKPSKNKQFLFFHDLPPGKYMIRSERMIPRKSHYNYSNDDIYLGNTFSLEKNKATILRMRFEAEQFNTKTSKYFRYKYRYGRITEQELAELKELLEKEEHFGKWELKDP